jgi:hypothetical protein
MEGDWATGDVMEIFRRLFGRAQHTRGAVSPPEDKHQAVLDEFEFRNYPRFGSQIRSLGKEESKNLPSH